MVSLYVALLLFPSFPTRRSSDLRLLEVLAGLEADVLRRRDGDLFVGAGVAAFARFALRDREAAAAGDRAALDRKSTRLNSSHRCTSYPVFCLKNKTRTPSSCQTT